MKYDEPHRHPWACQLIPRAQQIEVLEAGLQRAIELRDITLIKIKALESLQLVLRQGQQLVSLLIND